MRRGSVRACAPYGYRVVWSPQALSLPLAEKVRQPGKPSARFGNTDPLSATATVANSALLAVPRSPSAPRAAQSDTRISASADHFFSASPLLSSSNSIPFRSPPFRSIPSHSVPTCTLLISHTRRPHPLLQPVTPSRPPRSVTNARPTPTRTRTTVTLRICSMSTTASSPMSKQKVRLLSFNLFDDAFHSDSRVCQRMPMLL